MDRKLKQKEIGMMTALDLKSRSVRVGYWCFFAVILLLSVICLLPVLWVFLSAFKALDEFLQVPPTIIPKTFHPEKIAEVWNTFSFEKYYINSLIYVAGCLVFNIFLNGIAGYVISKVKPKGHKAMFRLIFLTMLLPTSMNMIPLYMEFNDMPLLHINITNTYWPMWLMYGIMPFTILLFKNFFDGIPYAYNEAAKLDGCSDLGIFIRIMIPLSMPIILVASILCVNNAWSEFMWPFLIVKDTEKFPVAVMVYNMSDNMSIDKYFVVLLLSMIPSIVLFAIFGRKMMGGISLGGVKG